METDAVLASIDKEELAELSVHLGNIPSPTGLEEPMGEAVYTWLEENGFHPAKMEVAPGRNNVVAVLKGAGEGKSLLFNSHMDTKYGAPGDEWGAGEVLPRHISAWRDGDRLYGSPVFNDRGPMAAFFLAAKAIRDGGIKLKGDLYLTAVVGEIGSAPVDEFQGPRYFGKGVGARHLVHHGVVADFALVRGVHQLLCHLDAVRLCLFPDHHHGQGNLHPLYPEAHASGNRPERRRQDGEDYPGPRGLGR